MFRWSYLFFFLFVLSNQAFAIGFGQAKLHSHLGEPLDIRVPLLLADDEKIQAVHIGLASPREYQNLEQRLPESYRSIHATIPDYKASAPEVYISSRRAIDESIIVLVLKVKRGRGNFYKKMQFFLDAADIKPTKETAWVNKPSPEVKFTPLAANQQNMMGDISTPLMSGWARRSTYGPVQYGDSLSEIAYRLRRDKRWSNRQVMLALFDKNPSAFVQQDINQLRKGSFLTVPDGAEMQGFVGSARYQELKPALLKRKSKKSSKKLAQKKEVKDVEVVQQVPRFRGKISLGLDENLVPAQANPEVLKRLDKLEPMYKQAMAASLRMDGIGSKVDALAEEVNALRRKIDALSMDQKAVDQDKTSYGFIGFMLLLFINIIVLLAYLYRKQMKVWQAKLMDVKGQFSAEKQEDDVMQGKGDALMFASNPTGKSVAEPNNMDRHEMVDSIPDLDEGMFSDGYEVNAAENLLDSESDEKDEVDHVAMFEEMVRKKAWILADEHYEKMADEDKERPRVQALLIQKMHCSGAVMDRNITLLKLSRLYDHEQWHRLCSYFDYDVWQEMQDEKIISFTGKVDEIKMDEMNQVADNLNAKPEIDEDNPVLDLSSTGTFDINDDDFKVAMHDSSEDSSFDDDDSVIDMGSVEQSDVEPIANIFEDTLTPSKSYQLSGEDYEDLLDPTVIRDSEKHRELKARLLKEIEAESEELAFSLELDVEPEQDLGEADTVIVTPEMLAEMEKVGSGKAD